MSRERRWAETGMRKKGGKGAKKVDDRGAHKNEGKEKAGEQGREGEETKEKDCSLNERKDRDGWLCGKKWLKSNFYIRGAREKWIVTKGRKRKRTRGRAA